MCQSYAMSKCVAVLLYDVDVNVHESMGGELCLYVYISEVIIYGTKCIICQNYRRCIREKWYDIWNCSL